MDKIGEIYWCCPVCGAENKTDVETYNDCFPCPECKKMFYYEDIVLYDD